MKKIRKSMLLLSLLFAFIFAMPLMALASSPNSPTSSGNVPSTVTIHTTDGENIQRATQNQTTDVINAIGGETGDAANTTVTWLQSFWETIKNVWTTYVLPWIVANPMIVVLIVGVLIVLLIFHKRH